MGFSPKQLRKIQSIVEVNQQNFLEKWDEYFNTSS
ncbi:DUF4160 domain-containing protein [Okeania sp. SIO1I7]